MPIPIDGLVAVAEYGSKFEADVVVNLLLDNGIAATTSYDPALNSVASYMASDRTVEVMVRIESFEAASDLLRPVDDLPDAFRSPEVLAWADRRAADEERRRGRRSTVVPWVLLAVLLVGVLISLLVVLV